LKPIVEVKISANNIDGRPSKSQISADNISGLIYRLVSSLNSCCNTENNDKTDFLKTRENAKTAHFNSEK